MMKWLRMNLKLNTIKQSQVISIELLPNDIAAFLRLVKKFRCERWSSKSFRFTCFLYGFEETSSYACGLKYSFDAFGQQRQAKCIFRLKVELVELMPGLTMHLS
ncbi:uncharacterized protein LOC141596801 isoform X2 [Silene latifolia]|uniref:uncharacterized protein LOC141596801 isoform X2 n=1 Tax=Silene latifolia TaxID=37657 RepID=UPI003D784E6E